jgi:hypothetical protein
MGCFKGQIGKTLKIICMKAALFLLALAIASVSCKKDDSVTKSNCTTYATVRDLTGLDGCGFVFELADGTRLEPLRIGYCGTPPLPKEVPNDPLYSFEFIAEKKVKIGYEKVESVSICMVGPVVKITCLEEVKATE